MLKDNPKVKTSFCYIHFGKQHKELTADELREFRRLMKAKKRADEEKRQWNEWRDSVLDVLTSMKQRLVK